MKMDYGVYLEINFVIEFKITEKVTYLFWR